MRLFYTFLIIIFAASTVNAEKLTIYTYDSFVSEWGPGPIIEKRFEEKYNINIELVAVDSAATLLNKIILLNKPSADLV